MSTKPLAREWALGLMRELPHLSDRAIARRVGVGNKTVSRWRAETGSPRGFTVQSLTTEEVLALVAEQGLVLSTQRLHRWVEAGLLPHRARARVFPGRGSTSHWWPGVVEQAREADRLMRRYGNARDVVLGLVAGGYDVEQERAHRAYLHFLEAIRDSGLLVPRVAGSRRAADALAAALQRRSLRGWRGALDDLVRQRGGIAAMSAEVRRWQGTGSPDRPRKSDVLYDEVDGTARIFKGSVADWDKRADFLNAIEEPPPREQLEELYRRLRFNSLCRAVTEAGVDGLQATCLALRRLFLMVADAVLRQVEREGGTVELTRAWHSLYGSLLDSDPLIPARIAPFFLSVQQSEQLHPLMGAWLGEAGMLFPDWRTMVAVLYTWPQLAAGHAQ